MSKGIVYNFGDDPEGQVWRWPETRESIREARLGDPDTRSGPTRGLYGVSFEYPHSYEVQAYTVGEAIYKALVLFTNEFAVHDPQVTYVKYVGPVKTTVVCPECGTERGCDHWVLDPVSQDEERVPAPVKNGKPFGIEGRG